MSIRHLEVKVSLPWTLSPQFPGGQQLISTGDATVSWKVPSHLPQASQSWKLTYEFLPPFHLQVKAKGLWGDQESISYGKPLAQGILDLSFSKTQRRHWHRSTGMWAFTLNFGQLCSDFASADKWARIYYSSLLKRNKQKKKIQIFFWIVFNLLFLLAASNPSLKKKQGKTPWWGRKRKSNQNTLAVSQCLFCSCEQRERAIGGFFFYPEGKHLIHLQLAQFRDISKNLLC